ncbi:MAG: hypothetical protein EOO53_03790 [Gammaproteobacteria bacterium]|nr:MAG: hypothetical protein EOO53_03790 [Gammaproteobacteria bacterium]
MNELNLSLEELKVLEQYRKLSLSKAKIINLYAVEIIPPAILVVLGLVTGRTIFFIGLICILVFYNILRVYRQTSYKEHLKSIAEKISSYVSAHKA